MLTIFAIILFVGWVLAIATSYTLGGWIHGLLVLAIILILIRLMQGGGKNEGII